MNTGQMMLVVAGMVLLSTISLSVNSTLLQSDQVAIEAQAGMVRFSVQDSGAGIPAEHLAQVFDRFFRAPGQDERSGAGLGLAISKEIITAHRGNIGVEPAPGGGSIFHFSLPLAGE